MYGSLGDNPRLRVCSLTFGLAHFWGGKKMKNVLKWAAVLLALLTTIVMVACRGVNEEIEDGKTDTAEETEATQTEVPQTEESQTEAETESATTDTEESATIESETKEPETEGPTYSEGLDFAYHYDGYWSVSGIGSCTDKDIVVPEKTPVGEPVTRIDDAAFRGCSNLTSIKIPEGVTHIGYQAFAGCEGLASIEIPDSVTDISTGAFRGCTNLTGIKIPNGVTTIMFNVFLGCSSLTSIEIPGSVTVIEDQAFSECTGLTSVRLSDSLTSIGYEAFYKCTSLESIQIPDSVTSIETSVFAGCSSLSNIQVGDGNPMYHDDGNCVIETATQTLVIGCKSSVIPTDGSVTSIGAVAFFRCESLESIVIPDTVTSIGNYAFGNCTGLKNIELPSSVTKLDYGAFKGCTALTSITLHDNITQIDEEAFLDCTGLATLTVGKGLQSIGHGAFNGCSNLSSIEVSDENPVYHSAGNCIIITENKELIVGCKTSRIPADGSVTRIKTNAFRGCSSLTSIEIPNTVTHIGFAAFFGCSGLESIVIPDSVIGIGDTAFSNCDSLTSIKVADGNPVYYDDGNCIIEASSKTLIAGCKSSTIPKDGSVTGIGPFAFHGCNMLTSITIPDSITTIGEGAFDACDNLTSITLGKGVTSIYAYPFGDTDNISSITVAEGNPVYHAEGNCLIETATQTVIVGWKTSKIPANDSVTAIGELAFYGYDDLTTIEIPVNVTRIDRMAFAYCSNLTSITFAGTREQWDDIIKGEDWCMETGNFTVHCTDGDIY